MSPERRPQASGVLDREMGGVEDFQGGVRDARRELLGVRVGGGHAVAPPMTSVGAELRLRSVRMS